MIRILLIGLIIYTSAGIFSCKPNKCLDCPDPSKKTKKNRKGIVNKANHYFYRYSNFLS